MNNKSSFKASGIKLKQKALSKTKEKLPLPIDSAKMQDENVKLMSFEKAEELKKQQIFERAVRENKSMMIEDKFRCAIAIKSGKDINWINSILLNKGIFNVQEQNENFYFICIGSLSDIIIEELLDIENLFTKDEKLEIQENYYYFGQIIMECMLDSCLGLDMFEALKTIYNSKLDMKFN